MVESDYVGRITDMKCAYVEIHLDSYENILTENGETCLTQTFTSAYLTCTKGHLPFKPKTTTISTMPSLNPATINKHNVIP